MNKLLISLIAAIFVTAAFAGCAKKGDGDEHTNASDLDETATYDSAIADNGFRVTSSVAGTSTALTGGANGSATSLKAADMVVDDAAGAGDKADFLIDAKEADGSRMQAELRSMVTADDIGGGGDFFGGVSHNTQINGATGVGYPDLPETKAYVLLSGLARVKHNEQTLDQTQLVQVAVTQGIRGDDGALLPAADADDLEVHVIFPGSLIAGNTAFPGVADGFVYYYFENVKLEQLTPDIKAAVGAKLTAPEVPNQPPVANGVVTVDGLQVGSANLTGPMLNVTLDASNSTDDGVIEAFSWDVKEYNATGVLVPLNRTNGMVANFSFVSAGLKQIDLRIIDEDGGIANTTIFFFVNYVRTYSFTFGGDPLTSAGAFSECMQAVNCQNHQLTVFYGATELQLSELETGGLCESGAYDVAAPDGTSVASGESGPLTIPADQLAQVGRYSIDVWFQAQVQCEYTFTATVLYAPPVAAAEEPAEDA